LKLLSFGRCAAMVAACVRKDNRIWKRNILPVSLYVLPQGQLVKEMDIAIHFALCACHHGRRTKVVCIFIIFM
ncbi:MAG: hypothetical protein ACI4AL_02055, partial [Aristaeellaceae bacterium]